MSGAAFPATRRPIPATDCVRAYPQLIAFYVDAPFTALGMGGFERSDQSKRNSQAAMKLMRKLLKKYTSSLTGWSRTTCGLAARRPAFSGLKGNRQPANIL